MARILKSFQSEGGFSVSEATIIDENRNVIDANTLKILNNSNDKTFKKEYIVHTTLNDSNTSVEMIPNESIASSKLVFISAFLLGTWDGYPIAIYTANANSVTVRCELENHGLVNGQLISVEFASPYTSFNNNYNVTIIDNNNFTFDTNTPLDINNPVLLQELEIISYPFNWEYAIKIESAMLSDSSNTLTLAAVSRSVVKDNIPPGHSWDVVPVANNATKTLTFSPSFASNTSVENRGNGIRWSGKVEIVHTERSY